MSMTLEETIAKCEERVEILVESMSACDLDDTVEKLIARNSAKCADEQRQLAEWLKELSERRKQPKIIHCGECRFNDGTAYCEVLFMNVKGSDYCSWGEKKHVENG